MATISDVAKLASVSKATVSRVLNGVTVRPESLKRVLSAIEQLDYRPNAQARSLTSGKTSVVGVLVPDMDGPFFGAVLEGCQQTLLSYGYNMMVCSTYHRRGNEWTFAKIMLEKRVDGLLIISPREIADHSMQQLLRDSSREGFPIVVADGEIDRRSVSGIWVDNFQGGYLATKHLLELGHSRIGVLTGVDASHETIQRLEGHRKALQDWKVPWEQLSVSVGNYEIEDAKKAAKRVLDKNPTAVFAFSDTIAAGMLEYCQENGIAVPDDLSVVGYDDIIFAKMVTPKLTTIRQPLLELGDLSATKLIRVITGEDADISQTTLPVELIVRESTAPPNPRLR